MTITTNRYTLEDVDSLRSLLQTQQNATPPSKITAKQAVLKLKADILHLSEQGWGWVDIVELLAQQGMRLNPNTLRDYLKGRPKTKPQPLLPLDLNALIALYREKDLETLTRALNKRNKITLSRFYKKLVATQESTINKMHKEGLVSAITRTVTEQARKTPSDEPTTKSKPTKTKQSSGEHDDLFNIDLGI